MSTIQEKLKDFFPTIEKFIENPECDDNALISFCLENLETVIEEEKLTYCILNQILHLFNEAGVSRGFYEYYFIYDDNRSHIYKKEKLSAFGENFDSIKLSESQLIWGLHCFYIDALIVFGNIKTAYRELRGMDIDMLIKFFRNAMCDTEKMKQRSDILKMKIIDKDDRYFLSEIVTKYLHSDDFEGNLNTIINLGSSDKSVESKFILYNASNVKDKRDLDIVRLNDILTPYFEEINNLNANEIKENILTKHRITLDKGKINNTLYLSQTNEIDIYVATSMRVRKDFDFSSEFVSKIESNKSLEQFNLRIFDPTNCVADNPYDKGLTECLMVKCCKVLIYLAGTSDSFGKDAEAAIALSLGKPVIIFCSDDTKAKIFRDIHPLTRLIKIDNGVACGAIITQRFEDIPKLLKNIFENDLEYELNFEMNKKRMLHLKDSVTKSCVRLQTADKFLSAAFWNNYHNVE